MPKRTDIRSISYYQAQALLLSGKLASKLSGTQACKALKEEGYRVILVTTTTIMTDPSLADATYVEPITRNRCQNYRAGTS